MNSIGLVRNDLQKRITLTLPKCVITGVMNFILSFIPPGLIALITLGTWLALSGLFAFWRINFIVENVNSPIFMKERLKMSLTISFLYLLEWEGTKGVPG